MITSCSANRVSATGSASSTLVSKTYVIRAGFDWVDTDFKTIDSLAKFYHRNLFNCAQGLEDEVNGKSGALIFCDDTQGLKVKFR
jgi:hypothetical protein